MIASSFFPAQPWVERLGWTLLHFLWQGVLIAKLFAAARAAGGRSLGPRSRYGLACASLVAMTLAPLATYWLIGTGSPLIPADASGWSARPFAAAYSSAAHGAIEGWQLSLPAISRQVLPWIVTAWLCGALAFSFRLAGGWALAERMRSMASARTAPAEWQRKLDRLIGRVGISRPVRLLVSSLAQTPLAIGYLRPVILMPVGALTGLPVEQIEALLAHELAHIRRHDYLVNLLQGAAEAMLFYHPSVWWVSKEIRAERELCCDDIAVEVSGNVLTYAAALAAVEAERPARLHAVMAASGGSLASRIRRLLDPSQPMSHTQPSPGAAAALAVLMLAGIGAAAMDRNPITSPVVVASPIVERPRTLSIHPPQKTGEAIAVTATRRVYVRSSDSVPPRPVSVTLLENAQPEEPTQETALSKRREDEHMARVRFGNSEFRSWAAAEGEPVLHVIEFRGMTPEFAREVQSRLPIRIGERVSHAAREEIGSMVSAYDRRLEFGLFPDREGGAVLRVHPPGLAGAELVRMEPNR